MCRHNEDDSGAKLGGCSYILSMVFCMFCLLMYGALVLNENRMFHNHLRTEDLVCSCLSETNKQNLSSSLKIKVCASLKR